jgi:hypothetical protein
VVISRPNDLGEGRGGWERLNRFGRCTLHPFRMSLWRMRPAQPYEIRVRGHLGNTMRRAFADLEVATHGGDTVLCGALADQSALHGVLAQIESLGLELLEVRRVPNSPDGTPIDG